MKKLLSLLALSALILVAGLQTASARERVAVVNPRQIIAQAPQARAMRKSLHERFDPQRRKLQAMQAKLQKEEKKFHKNQSIMSKAQSSKMRRQLTQLGDNLQRRRHAFAQQIRQAERKEFGKLDKRFSSIIHDIAKRDHYDIVLSRGVVYANHAVNITDKVLARLKEKAK